MHLSEHRISHSGCIFRWSLCVPKFEIQDASRNPVLLIEGPICTFNMCGDVEFEVIFLVTLHP